MTLVRQFLSEALLLAVVATTVGLFQAHWLMDVFRSMIAEHNPFVGAISINTALVLFTAALVLIVTVALGSSRRFTLHALPARASTRAPQVRYATAHDNCCSHSKWRFRSVR